MSNDYLSDREFASDFLELLTKYEEHHETSLVTKFTDKTIYHIKSCEAQRYLTFKHMICELFYQAINNMPHLIKQYTITCTNNKGVSKLIIGILDELDDDGEISVAKIVTKNTEFILNKYDVNQIYIANRTRNSDEDVITSIMVLLYNLGHEPIVKTSFIPNVNKSSTKF
jgi:intein-encoded DNA endonuclease-like protein